MPALAPAQPHAKFCFLGGALLVGGQSFMADLLPTYRQPPFHIVAAKSQKRPAAGCRIGGGRSALSRRLEMAGVGGRRRLPALL